MKSIARWIFTAVLAVTVAGAAQAQRPQPGQPGAGGRAGGGGVQIGLVLTNKDLQDELKVTDDQKSKLKDVTAKQTEMTKKMADLRSGGQPDRTKMQEVIKEMTALTEEVKKVTDEVLTADQKKRFKQLEIQAMGVRAFANADVVKELAITDDQKKALKEVADATAKETADLRKELGLPAQGGRPMGGGTATPPDAEALKKFAEKSKPMTEAALEKSVKALTADQQKKWTEMIGVKFDTSKLTARPMRMAN